jgi:hypothetical protein
MYCRWLSLIRSRAIGIDYIGRESEIILMGETGKHLSVETEVKDGF